MNILPAPYTISFLMYVPFAVIIICKFVFYTQASLHYLGNPIRVISELIVQATDVSFIACIHFWLHYIFEKKLHVPTLPLNVFFVAFYFCFVLLSIYDFENARYNMTSLTLSTLKAYVQVFGFQNIFSPPLDTIQSEKGSDFNALDSITPVIADASQFWAFLFGFFLLFFVFCASLLIKFRKLVYLSGDPNLFMSFIETFEQNAKDYDCSFLINKKYNMYHLDDDFDNPFFKTIHILAAAYLTLIVAYFHVPTRHILSEFTCFPTTFNLMMSITHHDQRIDPNIDILNITRRYLPKGRYWIDNRNDTIYPLVHGDLKAFCAYNNDDPKCANITFNQNTILGDTHVKQSSEGEKEPEYSLPNIAFLIYESLNPFSYLIDDDFLDEQSLLNSADKKFYITDTPYYSRKVLPNLHKFASSGITFSGLASQGLPTLSGWHSLMTGISPSVSYMNIVDGIRMHVDDLPSHFHDENYRTFFISAQTFDFDGMNNWVYRRSAEEEAAIQLKCENYTDTLDDPIQRELMVNQMPRLKKCTEKEIKERAMKMQSFPKWFDYVTNYFPDTNQSEILGLNRRTLKKLNWQSDRIVSRQYLTHWKQQKDIVQRKNKKQPLFGMALNVESHIPYIGYDHDAFYDQISPRLSRFSEEHKKQRFIRVNKYTDKYMIGNVINHLKKEDNHTIVIAVGDHGTRDVPIRRKNSKITEKTFFSGDCFHNPSGIDSMFITSGTIMYLGDDQRVKDVLKLDKLKGKTLKVATDHNDLTYTLMEILARLKNTTLPPTHKLGRNLIDFSEDIIETLNNDGTRGVVKMLKDMNWQSLSYLSYQLEYKKGSEFIRSHSSGFEGAHYYDIASFPTCLKRKGVAERKLGGSNAKRMFKEMMNYSSAQAYLNSNNRVYNYAFRDTKCIENGNCTLPGKLDPIYFHDSSFFVIIMLIPILVSFAITLLFCSIKRFLIKKAHDNVIKEIIKYDDVKEISSCDCEIPRNLI
ncbi:hypothetical protein TRFO_14400 [Tritrichomonas foetus]|uniref:Sulfatase N-terminal domain-containing protein n=1 Tax=Tritrichomonas foetus TaxID=1144522 RepID=A0A1J4L023_9EUKA|nr:hypothetical protein TRFO_14400 [Tritrichomonas foetus]|eukprot:OHT15205.1 hypothetical protein TRFO_14400 [Tritrichomonas foetus]